MRYKNAPSSQGHALLRASAIAARLHKVHSIVVASGVYVLMDVRTLQ